MKATHLRKSLFRTLDKVAQTGKSIEIESKGRKFKIIAVRRPEKFDCLQKHPDVFTGDLDDLCGIDWMKEWQP
jgi:hypothetical protein